MNIQMQVYEYLYINRPTSHRVQKHRKLKERSYVLQAQQLFLEAQRYFINLADVVHKHMQPLMEAN